MEYHYNKGQRLVIELINDQVFEGDCEKCGKDRIDLTNIVEHEHGNKLKDTLSYYRSEIASVTVLNQESQEEPQLKNKEEVVLPSRKIIAITQDEYDRLKRMTKEYKYFTVMDEEYSKAIRYLRQRESVAVFAIGCNVTENRISLLALSSRLQVYLFDLSLFGKEDFPLGLKLILGCHRIVKVIHGAQQLSDCLWRIYHCELNNVFDTQDTDLKLQTTNAIECKPVIARNLLECLEWYFNFPSTIVQETTNMNWTKWEKRPLKDSRKIEAAQFVAYLMTLKNKQKEILLKGHNDIVKTRMQTLTNLDSYEVQKALNSGDVISEDILKQISNIPASGYN